MKEIGNQLFNEDKVVAVTKVDETDGAYLTVTLMLEGGHTLIFRGDEALQVWNMFSESNQANNNEKTEHDPPISSYGVTF